MADARDPAAEQVQARTKAKAEAVSTVNLLLDGFVERHVRKNLRAADEVERVFDVYVRPRIGAKSIYQLRRSDVVDMLDAIEDENGPVMADRTLAHVRKAFAWHATRDDAFNSPIDSRHGTPHKPRERARKRALDDQEICDVRKALDAPDPTPRAFQRSSAPCY